MFKSNKRFFRTGDGRFVEDEDPDAAMLMASKEGVSIPDDRARAWGIIDEKGNVTEAARAFGNVTRTAEIDHLGNVTRVEGVDQHEAAEAHPGGTGHNHPAPLVGTTNADEKAAEEGQDVNKTGAKEQPAPTETKEKVGAGETKGKG